MNWDPLGTRATSDNMTDRLKNEVIPAIGRELDERLNRCRDEILPQLEATANNAADHTLTTAQQLLRTEAGTLIRELEQVVDRQSRRFFIRFMVAGAGLLTLWALITLFLRLFPAK